MRRGGLGSAQLRSCEATAKEAGGHPRSQGRRGPASRARNLCGGTLVRRKLLLGLLLIVVVAAGWVIAGPLRAWRSIERVPFNPTAAREQLVLQGNPRADGVAAGPQTQPAVTAPPPDVPATSPPAVPEPPPTSSPEAEPAPPAAPVDDTPESGVGDDVDVFLILGSDARPVKESIRSDSIMVLITDHSSTVLASIPRRLNVISPCTGQPAPINTNLEGCGEVTGWDLTAIAVEDYTGLKVDHLVMFGFEGFTSVIDRIGGFEVCVENPVKLSANATVFLETGCSTLDGQQALTWVRSRKTLEFVDGQWTLMEGAGDAARTERQRQVVLRVLQQLGEFDSPGALNSVVRELADSFILDSGWGLPEAISLAWDLRSISKGQVRAVGVAADGALAGGEFVLESAGPFSDLLEEFFG